MATIKSYTSLEQSHKLTEILPLDSADYTRLGKDEDNVLTRSYFESCSSELKEWIGKDEIYPCWSFAALYAILPELNGVSLKMEKVKAEDGYNGYYYPIEYEGIVLIPYSKNPVDACYELILKLNELNLL